MSVCFVSFFRSGFKSLFLYFGVSSLSGMASASPTSSVIVWEWKERSKHWIPYEANVCHFLEKKLLELRVSTSKKTPRPINLGECAASLVCYEVDLVRKEQRRPETGEVHTSVLILILVFPSGDNFPMEGISSRSEARK